jgi:outer membrane immunogenic protein
MRINLAGIAAVLTFAVTAASAADLYRSPATPQYAPYPPYVNSTYSWMGPYIGANFGYQWSALSNSDADPSGIQGGFQAGYNWQYNQLVLGAETDFQLSDARGTFANYQFSNPWFGTVRGRAGWAMNNILFYGTLGLAYGRGEVDTSGITENTMNFGWTAGGGLELGMTRNISLRAEYLYIDLGSQPYALTRTSNELTSNVLRFGVNYRF